MTVWWRIEDRSVSPVADLPAELTPEPEPEPQPLIPQINQGVQRERPRRPQVTLEGLMADPSRWVGGRARW